MARAQDIASIDPAQLTGVSGGWVRMEEVIAAGNESIEGGRKAGKAIGGTVGGALLAFAGARYSRKMKALGSTIGTSSAGAGVGVTAGPYIGEEIGGGVGWVAGAASNIYEQLTRK